MRNSNIELLRIVSMVLIDMFHFSSHSPIKRHDTHNQNREQIKADVL